MVAESEADGQSERLAETTLNAPCSRWSENAEGYSLGSSLILTVQTATRKSVQMIIPTIIMTVNPDNG